MKIKLNAKTARLSKGFVVDDLRYLQKKVSGRSVYKKLGNMYARRPKHRKTQYQY